jgi:hypothetical protein
LTETYSGHWKANTQKTLRAGENVHILGPKQEQITSKHREGYSRAARLSLLPHAMALSHPPHLCGKELPVIESSSAILVFENRGNQDAANGNVDCSKQSQFKLSSNQKIRAQFLNTYSALNKTSVTAKRTQITSEPQNVWMVQEGKPEVQSTCGLAKQVVRNYISKDPPDISDVLQHRISLLHPINPF